MRAHPEALLALGLIAILAGPASGEADPEEVIAAGPDGAGVRVVDPGPSLVPWLAGGALALAVGVVVASSATKPGRARADPLVTLPEDVDSRAFARGRDLAYLSPPASLEEAFRAFEARGYGRPVLAASRPRERVVDVRRCAECRRSNGAGCEAARGYLAAVFEILANREVDVVEVRCDPRSRACRFRVSVAG